MPLMLDRLPSAKFVYLTESASVLTKETYSAIIDDFIYRTASAKGVFDITNVADYFFAVDGSEYDNPESDFPNIAPPYGEFWTEFKLPPMWNIGGRMENRFHPTNPVRWGALVRAFDLSGDGWGLCFNLAGEFLDGRVIYPVLEMSITANADGTVREGEWPCLIPMSTEASENGLPPLMAFARFMVRPILLALSFLNCKNVRVTDNEGKHASRQERRAAERRNDPPLVTYKTLQIEPMKKVLATEGDIEKNGLAKALHICRGHFAEYGGESGKGKLFGKYEGRFYIPAHVRGSADVGVVHKRYNVKAPMKEQAA